MVNHENLEECINEAIANKDVELLEILLKLRNEPEPPVPTTEPSSKTDTGNVNVQAIAEYFNGGE